MFNRAIKITSMPLTKNSSIIKQSSLLKLWLQLRMDHEGKEFHHFDYFCQHYRTEILDLNRTLESLVRSGILPQTYHITHMGSSISVSTVKCVSQIKTSKVIWSYLRLWVIFIYVWMNATVSGSWGMQWWKLTWASNQTVISKFKHY